MSPNCYKPGVFAINQSSRTLSPVLFPERDKWSIRDPVFWNMCCTIIGVLTQLTQEAIESPNNLRVDRAAGVCGVH